MNELIQIGPISPLRQRLIDDMTLRGFSTETQRNYLRDVGRFATWLRRSPHTASTEDIGAPVPTWQADIDQMESMIDINATALARLTYAVAQRFAAAGNGTIINIASTVAIAPEFMLNGVYGATKAFVVALTASLHAELAD